MNRRELIKGAVAVGAAAVLPKVALAEEPLSGVAIAQRYFASSMPELIEPYSAVLYGNSAYLVFTRDEIVEIAAIHPDRLYLENGRLVSSEQQKDEEFFAGEQWTAEEIERLTRGR